MKASEAVSHIRECRFHVLSVFVSVLAAVRLRATMNDSRATNSYAITAIIMSVLTPLQIAILMTVTYP